MSSKKGRRRRLSSSEKRKVSTNRTGSSSSASSSSSTRSSMCSFSSCGRERKKEERRWSAKERRKREGRKEGRAGERTCRFVSSSSTSDSLLFSFEKLLMFVWSSMRSRKKIDKVSESWKEERRGGKRTPSDLDGCFLFRLRFEL